MFGRCEKNLRVPRRISNLVVQRPEGKGFGSAPFLPIRLRTTSVAHTLRSGESYDSAGSTDVTRVPHQGRRPHGNTQDRKNTPFRLASLLARMLLSRLSRAVGPVLPFLSPSSRPKAHCVSNNSGPFPKTFHAPDNPCQ
jgi:hypothetical protein